MRRLLAILFFCVCISSANSVFAMLSLELTRGVAGAVPIVIMPFTGQDNIPGQDVAAIISNDLKNSGRFKVVGNRDADDIVTGTLQSQGSDRYQVTFQLLEAYKSKKTAEQTIVLNRKFVISENQMRALAHRISDLIYQQITGMRGIFSTRLAYVVVQHVDNGLTRYVLEISDQDGYNPQPLLTSTDPIMSPAWSPDGKKIAYVSFENRRASIYIEDVATGDRHLISRFPGINGAPAWSPDGRKLALVLSKSGSPNIYLLNLATRQLTPLTQDWSINTEPAWSPDGKSIVFTSNRGGKPQIYQKNLATGTVSRVTYQGNYNARASFTPDGNHLAMITQGSDTYNIGLLDLDTGTLRILTNSDAADHDSPSMAPNGSMVLFGTIYNGRSVLGMAATDGSVQVRLPARNGEVQDPAWSPFLS